MFRTIYGQASFATLVLVVAAALLFGGRTERAGAGVLGAGALAGLAAQPLTGLYDPVRMMLGVDLAIFAGFVALTWRSSRRWPFFAVAFQGVELAVHVIRLLTHGMHPWTYLTALAAMDYGVMAALGAGAWTAWRRG